MLAILYSLLHITSFSLVGLLGLARLKNIDPNRIKPICADLMGLMYQDGLKKHMCAFNWMDIFLILICLLEKVKRTNMG